MKTFIKKYSQNFYISGILVLCLVIQTYGQEPKAFTTSDFDLRGPVKTCLVITDYGKEAFEFNQNGDLTKVTTQYSGSDYDVSYYRFYNGQLKEKRLENYRDDALDRNTSIANIYSIDTLTNKIRKEQIYSYQKDFLEQYEYFYNEAGQIQRILRTNNEGIDETLIEYDTLKGESTQSITVNGILSKTIRKSNKLQQKGPELKVILEKEFVNGEPYSAKEFFKDSLDRTLRELHYKFDEQKNSFAETTEFLYKYEDEGFLSEKITRTNKTEAKQGFIYQFDAHQPTNWIKKIITPDNKYITRRLVYYDTVSGKK